MHSCDASKTAVCSIFSPTRFPAIVEAGPLQVVELSQRLNVPATNISKHITVLRRAGIVTNDRPKLYGIALQYQVPGQPTLDFGVCLLRLDRLPA